MRISDWSSDVCSSDLNGRSATDTSSIARSACGNRLTCQTWSSPQAAADWATRVLGEREQRTCENCTKTQTTPGVGLRSEEHTSELQSLMRISYAVFCLKQKKQNKLHTRYDTRHDTHNEQQENSDVKTNDTT